MQGYQEFHQMGISQLTNTDHIYSPVLDRLVVTKKTLAHIIYTLLLHIKSIHIDPTWCSYGRTWCGFNADGPI